MAKLWGGRFSGDTDPLMDKFNASIDVDIALWEADIRGSIAYARALYRAGILTEEERDAIIVGLERIWGEFAEGRFEVKEEDEDIHTAVERRLHELIGPTAGKLHTGRSRNDQVVTDVRLYMLDHMERLTEALSLLQETIVRVAESCIEVIMPGYTHLQRAQPVRFSHWLMSYFWQFQRDWERLNDLWRRVDVCPLGSAALAGTAIPIDREQLAQDLGFSTVSQNSIDAVADRDFILEFLAWAAILGAHISRLAEDLIIWSTSEFGFVTIAEAYSTGSSIMPQKRNPDALELLRGKAGRLSANFARLLTTVKGLPSTYNKDLQEDKEPLFDTVETLEMALPILRNVIRTLTLHPEQMRKAITPDMLATDLAYYLVEKGVPFREAHHIVGQVVRRAEERGVPISELSLEELRAISPYFDMDVSQVWDVETAVERRSTIGGTARESVLAQIETAKRIMHLDD